MITTPVQFSSNENIGENLKNPWPIAIPDWYLKEQLSANLEIMTYEAKTKIRERAYEQRMESLENRKDSTTAACKNSVGQVCLEIRYSDGKTRPLIPVVLDEVFLKIYQNGRDSIEKIMLKNGKEETLEEKSGAGLFKALSKAGVRFRVPRRDRKIFSVIIYEFLRSHAILVNPPRYYGWNYTTNGWFFCENVADTMEWMEERIHE